MKNCFIIGTGRSGTSLMGGILHEAGYYMGDHLYPPRDSNPKGFFECDFINRINEEILEPYDFFKTNNYIFSNEHKYSPLNPSFGQRWLSYINPLEIIDTCNSNIERKISSLLANDIFAFKDPRFNYTLNVWLKYLDISKTVFICVFREPWITVQSILNECSKMEYLSDFFIDSNWAEKIWINNYKKILLYKKQIECNSIFVHYKQLLSGEALTRLSDFINCKLTNQFINNEFNRTFSNNNIGSETLSIYKELCYLADYNCSLL